ncbi:NAD(P)-binding domain-containing protein [Paenibacillus sediminis]|uniref:NADPH-dependent F420 reductase n=1 Tax=Paenibacillus sediminis TaxID=664909 RepID=A0ABS4H3X7_9BACL|nr:NAD(P)-binding domain-containing protein [Paenibacillus sediminis]MBP1937239.1 NADPH-dependent F420 reductase [Paenibacillus sediminis]
MSMSVIGTGRMGKGLVKILSQAVPNLMWGSRAPDRARMYIQENDFHGVEAVDTETALDADIIVHALWFRDLIPWAHQYEEHLKGKILIDIVNPFTDDFHDFILDWGTSAAEELQKKLPDTRVVGAFKNTFFKVFDQPLHQGVPSDVYVTSDDEEAKSTVIELLQGIPFRVMDAGLLQNNRTIERMTLFERELAVRYGHYPYVSFRLFGQDEEA